MSFLFPVELGLLAAQPAFRLGDLHALIHYAIRTLMFDAAEHAGHDPDRLSFVAALRISRRSIAQQGVFPPSRH